MVGPLVTTSLSAIVPVVVGHAFAGASNMRPNTVASFETTLFTSGDDVDGSPPGLHRRAGHDAIALCVAVAAALGLLRFVGSGLLLGLRLRGRRGVSDVRLLARLEVMRVRVGLPRIVLTESEKVGSPLVIGTREICVPCRSLTVLGDCEVDAVIAHELAHIERGDGIWFPVAGLAQSLLWLQPTNHWVGARFRQSAELACDDRAVEITGDGLGLARALVQLAASALFAPPFAMVPTMTRSGSSLLLRVRRLADPRGGAGPRAGKRAGRWATVGLAGIGAAAASLHVEAARGQLTQTPAPGAAAFDGRFDMRRDPAAASRPDTALRSERVADLARRARRLEEQISIEENTAGSAQEGTPHFVRLLELRQDLGHVQALEVWLESEFVEDWATWEKSRAAARRAPD
jgi:beta-lactamase regulating signal transducer with metallopeptidase domain